MEKLSRSVKQTNDEAADGDAQASIIVRLSALRASMTPVLKKIADRVALDPGTVISQTITEVADSSDTSEASVLRFCRDLGYANFKAFKLALAVDLADPGKGSSARLEGHPINDCAEIAIASLRQTKGLLSDDSLNEVVEKILKATTVDLVGLGGAAHAAAYANFRFISLGIRARWYADSHMAFLSAAGLDQSCVFLGFSESGEANETIAAMLVAKDAGAFTVALTCHLRSPLARAANTVLASSPLQPEMRGSFGTLAGQLLVVDVLASKLNVRLNN